MKTLIIHPQDKSTDFLKVIYANIIATIVTKGITKEELKNMIKDYDRIIMMGHGSPHGLFSVGKFSNTNGYIIDDSFVDVLKDKENIFIWCYASDFVKAKKLNGFSTGMFISEVGEAYACGVHVNGYDVSQDIVDASNDTFANLLNKSLDKNLKGIYEDIMRDYGMLIETNPVAKYNHERICVI